MTEITPIKVLEAIYKRPGMYWGNSNSPFTSLQAFLIGFYCGSKTRDVCLLPSGFDDFVIKRLPKKPETCFAKWQRAIEINTASEEEAFDLFFKLRFEYEEHQATEDPGKNSAAK